MSFKKREHDIHLSFSLWTIFPDKLIMEISQEFKFLHSVLSGGKYCIQFNDISLDRVLTSSLLPSTWKSLYFSSLSGKAQQNIVFFPTEVASGPLKGLSQAVITSFLKSCTLHVCQFPVSLQQIPSTLEVQFSLGLVQLASRKLWLVHTGCCFSHANYSQHTHTACRYTDG